MSILKLSSILLYKLQRPTPSPGHTLFMDRSQSLRCQVIACVKKYLCQKVGDPIGLGKRGWTQNFWGKVGITHLAAWREIAQFPAVWKRRWAAGI